jgi:2,4-diaminopentanoate dehydrogenase
VARVVLWGPGQIGIGALRATIQHPGLELAGLVVHSEAKEGRDAGDLCGLPPTGVIATRDIDRALAVDADVVAYFASSDYRYREAADDIARCLRAGRDVVTTSLVSFCWPPAAEPDLRDLLEAACAAGGATLFNSGIEPGWINDLVPFAFSSTCARIDRITMQEILDYSPIAQPDIMYDFMGFAHPPDTVTPLQEPGRLNRLWAPVVWGLAAGLGLTLDRVEDTLEKWIAPESYETASGPLPAGTVGGMRFRLVGIAGGEERIVLEHITRMGEHSGPDWPRHPSPLGGYRVILEGMPTYTVDIEMHGRGSNMRGLSFATFMRPLNAIPAVIAAPPGIMSAHDLPMVTGVMTGAEWTGVLA